MHTTPPPQCICTAHVILCPQGLFAHRTIDLFCLPVTPPGKLAPLPLSTPIFLPSPNDLYSWHCCSLPSHLIDINTSLSSCTSLLPCLLAFMFCLNVLTVVVLVVAYHRRHIMSLLSYLFHTIMPHCHCHDTILLPCHRFQHLSLLSCHITAVISYHCCHVTTHTNVAMSLPYFEVLPDLLSGNNLGYMVMSCPHCDVLPDLLSCNILGCMLKSCPHHEVLHYPCHANTLATLLCY